MVPRNEAPVRGFGRLDPRNFDSAEAVGYALSTPPDPKRTTPPFLPSDRGGEFARGDT